MDVLAYEAQIGEREASVDVREVTNYVAAMKLGLDRLQSLPLSRRLLCEVHQVLMRNVRGGEPHKTPGEVRRMQNWARWRISDDRAVRPPTSRRGRRSLRRPRELLARPGTYAAGDQSGHRACAVRDDPPVQRRQRTVGSVADHVLALVEQGILTRPLLYPSLYFKEHREEYIDRLQAMRDDGGWEDWLRFFVEAIGQVANKHAIRQRRSSHSANAIEHASSAASADAPRPLWSSTTTCSAAR